MHWVYGVREVTKLEGPHASLLEMTIISNSRIQPKHGIDQDDIVSNCSNALEN